MGWPDRFWRWISADNGNKITVGDGREVNVYSSDLSNVSENGVLGLTAAWACVTLLTGTISSLSLDVYRREGKMKVRAPDHELQNILRAPNADQTDIDFWEQMTMAVELTGNGFARISRRKDGSIIALTPLHPNAMQVVRGEDGALVYRGQENGKPFEASERDIFHLRGVGGDALGGLSPISYANRAFKSAMDIEASAAQMLANGVNPSGVLSTDISMNAAQRSELEEMLREKHIGAMNSGAPMLLSHGMKWQTISFNPQDAQMLESRGFSVEEVCRIFGVPPFLIGHTEKVTSFGSGLEQQILGFQKFTLRKRMKKIEAAIERQLLSPEDRAHGFQVSFNLEDLLRADTQARATFYRQLLDGGVISINEVRELEGYAPIEGGEVPRMQMQNVPITQSAAQAHGD